MKKAWMLVSALLTLLTLAGADYVLSTGGKASAGYACVPMALALASWSLSRKSK